MSRENYPSERQIFRDTSPNVPLEGKFCPQRCLGQDKHSFWEGDATKHFSVKKKRIFRRKGVRHSVNEGFGKDLLQERQFSEEVAVLILEGPTCKPRHASVFSMHSDTQAAPSFHCIRMFKGTFSTRAFLKPTDTRLPLLNTGPKAISTR